MTEIADSGKIAFEVKTAVFEGPLEVLLSLIEARKLFVGDVSLAQVTDDYIQYVKSLGEESALSMSDITSFIAVAATLILIKSKSLLPSLDLTREEEGQIDDLEKRLRLYQIYKNAGLLLCDKFGQNIIFSRGEVEERPVFSPDPAITIPKMLESIREVIQNLPKKEFLPEVSVQKIISIEEMISNLIDRVQTNLKLSFKEFTKINSTDAKEQKVYVIISFLAMLELVRTGIVDVIQNNNFHDIQIEKAI